MDGCHGDDLGAPSPSSGLLAGNKRQRQSEGERHTHMCCEVIVWAKFGPLRGSYLGQVGVIIWAKVIYSLLYSGFKQFFAHSVIILSVCWASYQAIF